jgi:hypothetical protein
VQIACIVEGEGEEQALPVLVRRIVSEIDASLYVHVFTAFVRSRPRLVKQHELARDVDLAARRLTAPGAILVVLDADDDCPATLGPRLLGWARAARNDIPVAVTVANREYEAWFMASAESLRGHRGLAANLSPPADPEAIRGAKEWLTAHMLMGQPYSPTIHQASFSQMMSLDMARTAASFRKLYRDVERLVDELRAASTTRNP